MKRSSAVEINVLYTRGEGIYIVERGGIYYLVNLDTGNKPLESEFAESFLKFGYFTEVDKIDGNELCKIAALLPRERR